MHERILFSEGAITVRKMTDSALDMTIEGIGHPLMTNDEQFPVAGSVTFSK